jgi:short-subunit dehydrogenase
MDIPLGQQVVVITGASSGIGRLTALEAARRRAAVVLAGRNAEALEEVAFEIERHGGNAFAVVTDVSDPGQVSELARRAVARFGRIDTWINNAGVSVYSPVQDLEPDEMRRVIEVNLLGLMYGCRCALHQMRKQGRGVIINVGSALSDRAVPLISAYVASKFGVRGFTDALRLELKHQHPGIRISLVLPASIDTPLFAQAKSKLGVKPRPIPPVYDVQVAADAILHAAEHPVREIYPGDAGKLLALAERLSPRLLDWWMLQRGRMFHQQTTDQPDNGVSNLFDSVPGHGRCRGEWSAESHAASPCMRQLDFHPWRKSLLLAGLGGALAALLLRRR